MVFCSFCNASFYILKSHSPPKFDSISIHPIRFLVIFLCYSKKTEMNEIFKNDNISKKGFEIVDLELDIQIINSAYNYISNDSHKQFQNFFRKVDHGSNLSVMDPFYYQDVSFDNKCNNYIWKRTIISKVNEQLKRINTQLESLKWIFLKSIGGGDVQFPNQDFSVFIFPRYAGIVSLSDSTESRINTRWETKCSLR